MKTEKITIELVAFTRNVLVKEIEVPAGASDEEIQKIMNDLYAKADGSDFEPDPEYWEKGNHTFERM